MGRPTQQIVLKYKYRIIGKMPLGMSKYEKVKILVHIMAYLPRNPVIDHYGM